MINDKQEFSELLDSIFKKDEKFSHRARRTLRWNVTAFPMMESEAIELLTDEDRLVKFRSLGRKTAEYIVRRTKEYLESLTLEERLTYISDDDFELLKASIDDKDVFEAGEVILYKQYKSEHYELGIVKRPCDDDSGDCFVWYHTGDTAARTPYSCMRKIQNLYAFNIERRKCDD